MNRISVRLISGLPLVFFLGVALFLRVYFTHDQVFGSDWIKFTSVDAYYYMRLVDNLVHNFPHFIPFDPYTTYGGGSWIWKYDPPLFTWLLAGIIWVIGLGSPTQHTIDVVGVYFPAVLGALTVIPVYFIGKELFGRWAGVISAGLVAIVPGEFLGRSILGFTDHHIAETLFSTTAMMFLIMAIKASRKRQLTISHLLHRDWATISKPIVYSLLAGIFLGMYLLSWMGALFFILIISVYFVVQFTIDHLRHKSTDYLCLVGVILFFASLVICVLLWRNVLCLVSLSIALLIPILLSIISRQMTGRGIRLAYYPLTLIGLGVVGVAILYAITGAIAPDFLKIVLNQISMFIGSGPRTIMEMQPLLFPQGDFTLLLAWGNFTTGFFISLISLSILIYLVVKRGSAEKGLLVVWSLLILAAALGQRRFAYYLAVNVALLTGYLSWRFLMLVGFKEERVRPIETPQMAVQKKPTPKKRYEGGFPPTIRYINMALAVIIIFFAVFFPNIKPSVAIAQGARFAPPDAWCGSLTWLKENTPEPFGDPDFYYHFYEPPPPGKKYKYPESAYAVTAWGDYGYWIYRIAHRMPNATPGPGGIDIAQFFLSQDEDSAQTMRQKLGSAYIIIDYQTTVTKLWSIATWAGLDKSQFYDLYFLPQEERKLVPTLLFYPEYYRSMMVRLYNFDGLAVTPEESIVISWEERMTQEGESIKMVTGVKRFPSYEEATAYISSQKSGNYRIVSNNPLASPVPLTTLKNYKLIHSSDSTMIPRLASPFPEVKIFEYIGTD